MSILFRPTERLTDLFSNGNGPISFHDLIVFDGLLPSRKEATQPIDSIGVKFLIKEFEDLIQKLDDSVFDLTEETFDLYTIPNLVAIVFNKSRLTARLIVRTPSLIPNNNIDVIIFVRSLFFEPICKIFIRTIRSDHMLIRIEIRTKSFTSQFFHGHFYHHLSGGNF